MADDLIGVLAADGSARGARSSLEDAPSASPATTVS